MVNSRSIIEIKLKLKENKLKIKDVAKEMGISNVAFSYKLKSRKFTQDEILFLTNKLDLDAFQVVELFILDC